MAKHAFIGRGNRVNNWRLYQRLLSKARRTIIIQRRKRQKQKARRTKIKRRRIRQKLNAYFDEIVNTFSIDFSNPELQDIQAAVLEMLSRITAKINDLGIFKISRIQPCGSMAEKTSLWKATASAFSGRPSFSSTEFDFLAVLETQGDCRLDESCPGCMKVYGPLLYGAPDVLWWNNSRSDIDRLFKKQIFDASVSSCSEYDKCTVSMPTGRLGINTSEPDWDHYVIYVNKDSVSLNLNWTSNAPSLHAPDYEIPMKNICISIDFLPALELFKSNMKTDQKLEHRCFVVPKKCSHDVKGSHADNTWRKSHCLAEVDHFVNVISNKHKKCYKVLKYICSFAEDLCWKCFLKQYNIKTAVLNHSTTCSDSSEDCAKCVVQILRELRDAYKCGELTVFNGQTNVIGNRYAYYLDHMEEQMNTMLTLMSTFESRETFEKDCCEEMLHILGIWDDQIENGTSIYYR